MARGAGLSRRCPVRSQFGLSDVIVPGEGPDVLLLLELVRRALDDAALGVADDRGQLADEAHGDVGLVVRRVEAGVDELDLAHTRESRLDG